ncbi:hypothetical protein IWX90DRAFT_12124 [Phyllosticta citrichinensis]|uniref:RRM domain-containing protein n=1 Tax=Phyllosticta citrichinensis TaxID=1130410 RepID=A0ABR1Y6G2_9PEZI
MPRPRIPHGNRPRVPAGSGTSRNQTSGALLHHRSSSSSRLAKDTFCDSPEHNVGALSHSPHLSTHPTTNPPPKRCPAASPSFSQHFSSNHVSEEDTRRRGSKHTSIPMAPPVASFYAPTGSGKPPASQSLLGQSYKPPSNEKFAKLPAVTMVRASPGMGNQGEVTNGPKTQSEPAAHPFSVTKPTQDNHAGKSLLGQSYQAPSKEKFATVPAVKMVRSEPQKQNADLHGRPEPSGVKLKDKEKENSPIVSSKTDDLAPPAGGAEQKAVVSNGEEGLARFSDDSGRRVCLANVPPGTSKTDVRDMLVSQASAKVSLEDITVYSFQGSRPSYALVEAENEQEAGRIAIWIDRECLFGWPISARVVRTMTKGRRPPD